MSRHNRERRKLRMAAGSKPAKFRPDRGPPPTYRDDNPNPYQGEKNGKKRQPEPAVESVRILRGDEIAVRGDGTIVLPFTGIANPDAEFYAGILETGSPTTADGQGIDPVDQNEQATPRADGAGTEPDR